ncbi:hypothetical protein CRUP_031516 [Coryphaenoides rupestris]|nr:hypothetical protein CRUP_031516 [Coryphaenoides rupestris]
MRAQNICIASEHLHRLRTSTSGIASEHLHRLRTSTSASPQNIYIRIASEHLHRLRTSTSASPQNICIASEHLHLHRLRTSASPQNIYICIASEHLHRLRTSTSASPQNICIASEHLHRIRTSASHQNIYIASEHLHRIRTSASPQNVCIMADPEVLLANVSGCGVAREVDMAIKVLVPTLDALILVTGLLGQSLVIAILAGRRRRAGLAPGHTPQITDTLLLALSGADLLLLLCLPFHTAAISLGRWPFGGFLCKAISFLGVACSAASGFTLAALAVTRYLAVVHPARAFRSGVGRRVRLAVALLWVPAAALAAPQFAFRAVSASSAVSCFAFLSDVSQLLYSTALFLGAFALPLGIIMLMYAQIYRFLRRARRLGAPRLERYQRQVTLTSALLVVVFTLLWLPSYGLMFSFVGGTMVGTAGHRYVAVLARLLASSAAVVNPILYAFMSHKFRRDLLDLGRARWDACRSVLIGCPHVFNRDTVQPFELDTTSDRGQN